MIVILHPFRVKQSHVLAEPGSPLTFQRFGKLLELQFVFVLHNEAFVDTSVDVHRHLLNRSRSACDLIIQKSKHVHNK